MLKKLFNDKKFIFIFTFVVESIFYYLFEYSPIGGEFFVPDIGISPVFGMMFGPVGGFGQALANLVCQLCEGLDPIASIIDFAIMFTISLLAYKLWYATFTKKTINTPKFDSAYNIFKFLIIAVIVSAVYWGLVHISLEAYHNMYLTYPMSSIVNRTSYAVNMFNFTIILGIFFISIFNIAELPMQTPKKWFGFLEIDNKYLILSFIIIMIYLIPVQIFHIDNDITDNLFFGLATVTVILFSLNKFEAKIEVRTVKYSIIEKITLFFLIVLLILLFIIFSDIEIITLIFMDKLDNEYVKITTLSLGTALMMIMCLIHIHYIEKILTDPIYDLIDLSNQYRKNKKVLSYEEFKTRFKKYLMDNDDISRLIESFGSLSENIQSNLINIKQTTAEKEKIETEFEIASHIQSGMLKTNFDEFSNGRPFEIYGFMKPAKEVGGDFYNYFDMDEENIAFVIGDVSGKGIPATLFMIKTMQLIENHSKFDTNPEELFENVNNLSCIRNDNDLFVTSLFGKLNLKSGKLIFVNAGHNPPLIKQKNKDFEYLHMEPNFVLGEIEDIPYRESEIDLTPGDMIFLYTDGVTEANDNYESFYGENRLKNTLNNYKNEKLENIVENVKNDLYQFCDSGNQFDDITMLIIKYKGCGSHE